MASLDSVNMDIGVVSPASGVQQQQQQLVLDLTASRASSMSSSAIDEIRASATPDYSASARGRSRTAVSPSAVPSAMSSPMPPEPRVKPRAKPDNRIIRDFS